MSKGAKKAASAKASKKAKKNKKKEKKAKAGGLEAVVSGEPGSQQEGPSSEYKTNSSQYDSKRITHYNMGSSNYQSSQYKSSSKKAAKNEKAAKKGNKKKSSDNHDGSLEMRIGQTDSEVASLVARLVEGGMSAGEAQSAVSHLYAGQKREGNFPLHINPNSWYNLVNQYMKDGKINIRRLFKSAVQLFLGLTSVQDGSRNPYKDIENGADVLFVTGWGGFPAEISFLEEHSGKKMVYLNTVDPAVVDHYARLIMYKHGKLPDVIGFSDGAKTMKNYGDKYGFSHVNQVYAVGYKRVIFWEVTKDGERYDVSSLSSAKEYINEKEGK